MAKLIKTNGEISEVFPLNKENGFSLEELYKYIECNTIDALRIGDEYMVLDDEGLLKDNSETNIMASVIYGDTIVGNVMLCSTKEFQ